MLRTFDYDSRRSEKNVASHIAVCRSLVAVNGKDLFRPGCVEVSRVLCRSPAKFGSERRMSAVFSKSVDQKHLESFEMWCWRWMEKICWTDHVRNEEVLLRVQEQRNILHEISKRKANWIGHILRRNCLLQRLLKEI